MARNVAQIGKRGRTLLWSQTCTIKRASGDASLYGPPAIVHLDLKCSLVTEMTDEEREKWFLATVSRALKLYTEVPKTGTIKEQDLVYVNDERYVVMKANRWPHSSPHYYELFVEYRRGQ